MSTIVFCLAPGCKNNSKINKDVIYHKIPKEHSRWQKFCSLNRKRAFSQRLAEQPEIAICSSHFKPEDYQNQGDHVLFDDAVPSVPAPFEETNEMCYICFSPSSDTTLLPFDEDAQQELELMGVGFIQIPNAPQKLCEICHNELGRILTYLHRVKSANDFWHKFGVNLGAIFPRKKLNENEDVPKNLSCKDCNSKFMNKDALHRHIWKFHAVNESDPTMCSVCCKKCATEMSNRQHYFQNHYTIVSDEQLVCSDCGYLAKSSNSLSTHMKYSHDLLRNEDRVRCEYCIVSFTSQARLDLHMEERHSTKIGEELTKMEMDSVPVMKYEIKLKKETEKKVSVFEEESNMDVDDDRSNEMCNDVDDDEEAYQSSVNVKQEKESKPTELESVLEEYKPKPKTSSSSASRSRKYKTRTYRQEEITQKCPECDVVITGKFVMARGGIYRHYWVRHGRLPETPNVCKSCAKSYNTEASCRKHFFDHHFDMTFCCEICGKTGMTKLQLTQHLNNSHKNDGKDIMVCRFCNRKYDTVEKMQEHEATHKNDGVNRPFVCNECGKHYSSSQTLSKHMNQHMGIRPYQCQYCDMAFNSVSNMRVHEVIHTGLNPYKCSLCEKEFKQLGLIKSHIERRHGSFDKYVLHSEIIIRQHGKTSYILGEKTKRKPSNIEKVENVRVVYNNDYYDASNSINSL